MISLTTALTYGASAIYACTALICVMAGQSVQGPKGRSAAARWWMLIAAFFCFLIVSRMLQLESGAQIFLRDLLRTDGEYGARRDFQAPFAAMAVIVIAGMAVWAIWPMVHSGTSRRAQLIGWARLGVVAMVGLIGLRTISFHPVDALLYHGPHLNWIIDIGSSALVGGSAWQFRQISLQSAPAIRR